MKIPIRDGGFTCWPALSTTLFSSALLIMGFGACSQDDEAAGGSDASADVATGDAASNDPGLARPEFITFESTSTYDGASDDLLTAGLGVTGLQGKTPAVSDPPTAAELRRLAIYSSYRALVDTSADGGFGRLFGPNLDNDGHPTGDGKVAGTETLAFIDDGTGQVNVTVVIQVPAAFDPKNPCIVLATSSGSRAVYGAIGNAGEWGLKHGCAVAYHDKGTGNGAHDLQNDVVVEIDGTRKAAPAAGKMSNFTAKLTEDERGTFNQATPNRFAFKHAHSEQNPEKRWGEFSLNSIRYAVYILNKQFGTSNEPAPFSAGNTMVIASSASNGAGAALLAAEQDSEGLIDGVAVSEPQITPPMNVEPPFSIQRGSRAPFAQHSKSLDEYATYANLYQPCAALSASLSGAPGLELVDKATATKRCASLASQGLLTASDVAGQAAEALDRLHQFGYEAESDLLHASYFALAIPPVALNYVLAHGRFSVKDDVCGFSYGATDAATGAPAALAPTAENLLFGVGNGIPPTGGVNIINNLSLATAGGTEAKLDSMSVSRSTASKDFNVDGALCLRSLATGVDPRTGSPLTGEALAQSTRARAGMTEVRATANLHGKPAIIVAGRSDALVPTNHGARAYFGATRSVEGDGSALSYYEIANGQHFDAFMTSFVGYAQRYIPVDVYLKRALDVMYNHLKNGTAIPASQVVRTVPRGSSSPSTANPLAASNVPAIAANPGDADKIVLTDGVVRIPE